MDRRIVGFILLTWLVGASLAAPPAVPVPRVEVTRQTQVFQISGMHCESCARGLASELSRASGVSAASVVFSNQTAEVTFDVARTSSRQLLEVIREAGYRGRVARRR